mmetsp:Transcript_46535/g.149500  ORF Transcript_46535/g.149500 Transcript_46535/m.149500 type:complete len:300 (-) Transcript_46535:901-1800(-)
MAAAAGRRRRRRGRRRCCWRRARRPRRAGSERPQSHLSLRPCNSPSCLRHRTRACSDLCQGAWEAALQVLSDRLDRLLRATSWQLLSRRVPSTARQTRAICPKRTAPTTASPATASPEAIAEASVAAEVPPRCRRGQRRRGVRGQHCPDRRASGVSAEPAAAAPWLSCLWGLGRQPDRCHRSLHRHAAPPLRWHRDTTEATWPTSPRRGARFLWPRSQGWAMFRFRPHLPRRLLLEMAPTSEHHEQTPWCLEGAPEGDQHPRCPWKGGSRRSGPASRPALPKRNYEGKQQWHCVKKSAL